MDRRNPGNSVVCRRPTFSRHVICMFIVQGSWFKNHWLKVVINIIYGFLITGIPGIQGNFDKNNGILGYYLEILLK